MKRSGKRPLLRTDLPPTYIAELRLLHFHLPLCTRQMLMLGKMILTETMMAIWTPSQRLLVTFTTTASRVDNVHTILYFSFITHAFSSPTDNLLSRVVGYILRKDLLRSITLLSRS